MSDRMITASFQWPAKQALMVDAARERRPSVVDDRLSSLGRSNGRAEAGILLVRRHLRNSAHIVLW